MTSPTLRSTRFQKLLEAGDIDAGAMWFEDFTTNPQMLREVPFNNIIIRNFSEQRLKVTYGHDTVVIVGAKEIYQDDAAYGLINLRIENTDSKPTNDIIYIQVSRVVTGDMALLSMASGENVMKIANGDS
jgi:hypothetical protein